MEYLLSNLEKNLELMSLTDSFQIFRSGCHLPSLDLSAMISLMAPGFINMMENQCTDC